MTTCGLCVVSRRFSELSRECGKPETSRVDGGGYVGPTDEYMTQVPDKTSQHRVEEEKRKRGHSTYLGVLVCHAVAERIPVHGLLQFSSASEDHRTVCHEQGCGGAT